MEASRFKDYWIAKAGKDGVKADWLATWRNWIRNGKFKPRPTDAVDDLLSRVETPNKTVDEWAKVREAQMAADDE